MFQLGEGLVQGQNVQFFAGLTTAQAATALGVSTSTADNDWAYARCWLRLAMDDDAPGEPG